jgi:uncharacterized integral membrane protein
MVRKLVFWLALVPLAIVILMFAVANREIVTVSFDPFNAAQPAASISVPLFVLIFALVILGVIIGGVASWLRQSGYRKAARRRDSDVDALRRENEALNARLADYPASSNATRLGYRPPAGG